MNTRTRFSDRAALLLWFLALLTGAVGVVGLYQVAATGCRRSLRYNRIVRAMADLQIVVCRINDPGTRLENLEPLLEDADNVVRRLSDLVTHPAATSALANVAREIAATRILVRTSKAQEDAAAFQAVRKQQIAAVAKAAAAFFQAMARAHADDGTAPYPPAALWQGWAFALTCGVLAVLLISVVWAGRIEHRWLRPISSVTMTVQRVSAGETFLRIPQQRNPVLRDLAEALNRFIDDFEQLQEESRRAIRLQRAVAAAAADAVGDPILLFSAAGELLFCNSPGREVIAGETGKRLLEEIRTIAAEKETTVVQRGKQRFTLEHRIVELSGEPDGRMVVLRPRGAGTSGS